MRSLYLLTAATACVALPRAAQASETITYSYDALGRVVQVVRDRSQGDDWNTQITYDKAGNRTNYTSTDTTAPNGNGNNPPPVTIYKARVIFNGRFYVSIKPN